MRQKKTSPADGIIAPVPSFKINNKPEAFFHPSSQVLAMPSTHTLQACVDVYQQTQEWLVKIHQLRRLSSLRQQQSHPAKKPAQTVSLPALSVQPEKLVTYQLANTVLQRLQHTVDALLAEQQAETRKLLQFPIP